MPKIIYSCLPFVLYSNVWEETPAKYLPDFALHITQKNQAMKELRNPKAYKRYMRAMKNLSWTMQDKI